QGVLNDLDAQIGAIVGGTSGLWTDGGTSIYPTTAGATAMTILDAGNVGIGTTGPDAKLDSLATTEQLRLTYTDGTVYSAHTVDSSGNLTIDNTGTKTVIADDLQVTGGDILDSNGNESIRFGTTASAVNEATLTNAATAGTVLFTATGGDTDIAFSIDSKGADALNLNGTATGDVNLAGGYGGTGCTVTNSNGNLSCNGTITGTIAGTIPWSEIDAHTGALTLAHATYATTFGWTPTGALDAWTMNLVNNGGSATTQDAVVINNAVAGSFTDTTTENLVLLQQLDTTTAGTTVLTNALKIDVAANSGMTNGINITNSAGNLTTGINIVDTAGGTLTTGIALSGTFTTGIDAGSSIITNIGNSGTDFDTSGGLTLADDIAINGGDLTTTAATFNVANAATTLNLGSTNITRTINIGTGTSADTINI
ncbi:MAG: hypothetical protein AAB948_04180, partial [Patescibacteria group bacterium]